MEGVREIGQAAPQRGEHFMVIGAVGGLGGSSGLEAPQPKAGGLGLRKRVSGPGKAIPGFGGQSSDASGI